MDGHNVPTTVDEPGAELCAEFSAFVTNEFRLVVAFVMLCGASLDEAQDAVQEAFADAWRDLKRGRWQGVRNQEGWIRTVALRKLWHTRRNGGGVQIIPVPDLPDLEQSGLSTVDLTDETLDVIRALSALNPVLRAVMAYDMAGFRTAETARALGLTGQKVRDQRKRARRKLAKQLGEWKKQKGEQA